MNAYLETKDLVKKYRKRVVVDHVSLRVGQGEIVGLLGCNGAGKTTTFRMVVGLIRSDYGQIFFNGQEISHLPMYVRARMGIGYLPQEPTIFRQLTVRENLEIILENWHMSKQERQHKIEELLTEMKMLHLIDAKAGPLSGGEKRRLEVARTLAISPSLIMLDEPFAAVDPKLVEGLQDIILHLRGKNIGILITDHKAEAILSITDRAYVIDQGKILKHGTPKELAEDAEVRAKYLGDKFFMVPAR
jgi:lipopolysaccharide export system ATP-binding protein